MATDVSDRAGDARPAQSILYNPELRGKVYQGVTLLVVVWLLYMAWSNAAANLQNAGRTAGFGFLNARAGFDLGQTLIAYTSDSTYFWAFVVGLLNTLRVAILGIVTATIVGILIGVGRMSQNWIVARLCTVYVEVFRNLPPLLVIFFWYLGVLALLPDMRGFREELVAAKAADPSFVDPVFFVVNRGIFFPAPVFGSGFWLVAVALAIGAVGAIGYAIWARRKQMRTGVQSPILIVSLAAIIGLPALAFLAMGAPLSFDYPIVGRFNASGGASIGPEFLSLYLALSLYTASFIAEIVRAGIKGVSRGQSEAANALGIRPGKTMRLVVLPQALRIIIPPLTSQYLNLTKNSSLAVAVGYADLVAVGNTILNQNGKSLEVIAIWMLVYITVSLATSLFMNWFNAKMALVER